MKPADQIVLEVLRVLTESGITFKHKGYPQTIFINEEVGEREKEEEFDKERYTFKCKQKQPLDKAERVYFDLEICQIQGLNMNGVRFKRISGGVWAYRSLCQSLMQKMKL